MNEEQLMVLIGRLYVASAMRDAEIKRLTALIAEYDAAAHRGEEEEVQES